MFEVQAVATQVAAEILIRLGKVPATYGDLADQARRAAASVALNIAEASGRIGKDRQQHFRIAYGSAQETATALELLAAIGVLGEAERAQLNSQLDRVRAMTWRLAGR